MSKRSDVFITLFFFLIMFSIVALLVFISLSKPDVVVSEVVEVTKINITCSNPFFNVSDGYWYCNIDDVVVVG